MSSYHMFTTTMLRLELEAWATSFRYLPQEAVEYEVRFDPVTPKWIDQVKRYLDLMGTPVTMTKSTDTFYPMSIRKEETEGGGRSFMRKVQLQQTTLDGGSCRLAISLEKPLTKYDLQEKMAAMSVRYKKRWSYQLGEIQLDISHVIINKDPLSSRSQRTRDHVTESHEMEIELPRGWRAHLLDSVADLIKTINQLCPDREQFSVDRQSDQQRCNVGLRRIFQGLGGPRKLNWPGVLPDTLTLRNQQLLSRHQYAIATKLDGGRTVIYLEYVPELGRVVVGQVNRNMEVSVILPTSESWIPGPLYLHLFPAVIDCEMMHHPLDPPTYHAFDLLACSGTDIRSDPEWDLVARISRLADICQNSQIVLKPHYWLNSDPCSKEGPILSYQEFDPERGLQLDADGYIFTMVDATYLGNNHQSHDGSRNPGLLKWKPKSHQTVDFLIEKLGVTVDLPDQKESWDLGITTTEGVKSLITTLVPITVAKSYRDKAIVECRFDDITRTWQPVRLREDKTLPNFVNTVEDVLESIESPVNISQLLNMNV